MATHRDAAHIVKTITEAVVYLHNQGIVHRGTFGVPAHRLPPSPFPLLPLFPLLTPPPRPPHPLSSSGAYQI
jgi:serine/threonine protein kinase